MKKEVLILLVIILLPIYISCSNNEPSNVILEDNNLISNVKKDSLYGFWKQCEFSFEWFDSIYKSGGNYIFEFTKDSKLNIYKVIYKNVFNIERNRNFNIISENQIVIANKNLFYEIKKDSLKIYDEGKDNYYNLPFIHCDKPDVIPIPYKSVRLQLYILTQDYYFQTFATKLFTEKRTQYDEIGYGGILVINGGSGNNGYYNQIYAYDLACPVEADQNIRVVPDELGKAKCPKCGTVYIIWDGSGKPENDESKYPLLPYYVYSISNGNYMITNYKTD